MRADSNRGKSILYVITSSGIGGSEQNLYRLAVWMRSQGFHVQVCCIREGGVIAERLEKAGISVICFNERERPRILEVCRSILRLRRVICKNKIDLVHSFLLRANLETRLAKKFCQRRFVLINSERGINYRDTRMSPFLDKFATQSCDLFLANSEAVKNSLLARKHIPAAKVRTVYSGVDTVKFRPRCIDDSELRSVRPTQSSGKVIGYVGRLHPEKGVRYLIEAIYVVSKEMNDCRLVIVGDGSEASYLQELVKRRQLENQVSFVGVREDIARVLSTLDILVLPSLEEGLPTIVLEALASGVSVVATAVGGTPEIIEHQKTGLLVPSENVCQLSDAILQLLRDETTRKRLVQNGRMLIDRKFKSEKSFEKIHNIYCEALDR